MTSYIIYVLYIIHIDWVHVAEVRGQMAGCCECGNETSVSITEVKFLRHQSLL